MRKVFGIITISVSLSLIASVFIILNKNIRLQIRFGICRELAHYVVENDGRFPTNWASLTKFSKENNKGDGNTRQFERLEGIFSLPWGENITNTSAIACAWFNSVDTDRNKEDRFFSRFALGNMWAMSTNNPVLRNFIDAALQKY